MKRSDLKKIIKPIVKECIQESLLEDGVLSKVISEVALGLSSTNSLVKESRDVAPEPEVTPTSEKRDNEALKVMREQRQKMLDAIGKDSFGGVDLFEGTEPLRSAGTPGQAHTPSSPLGDVDPRDPGVDISDLAGTFGDTWRVMSNG